MARLWLSIQLGIGNVITPTDEVIFFRGVETNHQPVSTEPIYQPYVYQKSWAFQVGNLVQCTQMDWNLPPITKHQYVVAIYGSIVVMMHNDGYLTNNNWLVVSISV